MKKIILAFTLLLSCCSPLSPVPTLSIRDEYPPSLESFKSNETCPSICWLGIHPGITTFEQSIQLIKTSDQFDQRFTKILDTNIKVYWFPEKTKTFGTDVNISFSNKLVKSITLGRLTPFTINDFIGLLGQPTEISLAMQKGLHDDKFIVYNLYYTSLKASIQVRSGSEQGPEPNDFIEQLTINTEIQDNYRQPWLGYGHFDEYLLRTIPTPTIQTMP